MPGGLPLLDRRMLSASAHPQHYLHRMAFQPFDPSKTVDATRRNLPHWQQEGATYFVTFRRADSLPAAARSHLVELRALNDSSLFDWLDRYLDAGAGACLFADPVHASMMEATLRHFHGQRYTLHAYAIMPNHVHVLVQPQSPHSLRSVVHSWKSYSARQLQIARAGAGQIWQEESFDRIVRDEAELNRYRSYIAANPATARLPAGSFIVSSEASSG